ncbi:MAG: alpha-mannosidase [Thermomicrobiales bacterium]
MVVSAQQRRALRLERRIKELRAWRNALEIDIPEWRATYPDGETFSLSLHDFWPRHDLPVVFEAACQVPSGWKGYPVEIELWLGGEGFVRLSTGFRGGLNVMHHRFPVADPVEGQQLVEIWAEVVPKGIFGSDIPEPRIERAALVAPHREVRALERDLTMVDAACSALGDHEVVPFLFDAAEAALSDLAAAWPTSTSESVSRYARGYETGIGDASLVMPFDWQDDEAPDNRRSTMPIWSMPETMPIAPLEPEAIAAVLSARQTLAEQLDRIKENYPPVGRLCLTGHAHTDLAWLWPLAETRRKIRRTWWSVIDLMDRYPDFTFNQSSAQAYAWVEEDDPELFARVKARVAEGRWEAVGGSWVEPDANITGGEAFARQLLYGQQYFQEAFGSRHTVIWLPDVFGYSGGLPQILRQAGIDGFFTIKLNWNEANQFPFDLFEWEGIDGTCVTAHTFSNPGHGYNGNIVPFDTLGTWRNFRGKTIHDESIYSFGWGDGAGGPSEKMLENYARISDFPALPRLRMGSVEKFFAELPSEGLPKAVGELYLELHRGTLTSQALVKKNNRSAEHRLFEAEVFNAIDSLDGAMYPSEALERAWKTLLLNQFHDILPGSSINEVYVDSHRQMAEVIETATSLRDRALSRGVPNPGRVLVANPGLYPRPLTVELPGSLAEGLNTSSFVTQGTSAGMLVAAPGTRVPALGAIRLDAVSNHERLLPVTASVGDDGFTLENATMRFTIGHDGTIASAYDREMKRETLADRGNQLWAYVDKPYAWDAWDVDETYARDGEEIVDVTSLGIVETGPIRATVRIVRKWRSSTIVQSYRLWHDSKRLDIETEIEWHERQVLLKAHVPLAVRSHQAAFETMYGAIHRPSHRNGPWDAARFEGCGHRWGDISEAGYGVALLNDGKYGYEALGNDLMLSLLRGPLYPDPLADEGQHRFTYSVFPHAGTWSDGGVVEEAFRLNSPLVVIEGGSERPSFVEITGLELAIGALKRAEDDNGVILRLYEPNGARGSAVLKFGRSFSEITPVDILEDAVGGSYPAGSEVALEFRPFEIKSLRLVP